jgi:hypothetical protein
VGKSVSENVNFERYQAIVLRQEKPLKFGFALLCCSAFRIKGLSLRITFRMPSIAKGGANFFPRRVEQSSGIMKTG